MGAWDTRYIYEWDYVVVPRIAGACVCSRAITFNAGARAGLTTRSLSKAYLTCGAKFFLVVVISSYLGPPLGRGAQIVVYFSTLVATSSSY